jgi:hypothetical protein
VLGVLSEMAFILLLLALFWNRSDPHATGTHRRGLLKTAAGITTIIVLARKGLRHGVDDHTDISLDGEAIAINRIIESSAAAQQRPPLGRFLPPHQAASV